MTSAVLAVIAALGAGFGSAGFWAYLQSRRAASGRVITTPAETLWQQMQQMLTSYQERLDKAEAQRDKLLDGYQAIAPTLESIDSSLRKLLELSARDQ